MAETRWIGRGLSRSNLIPQEVPINAKYPIKGKTAESEEIGSQVRKVRCSELTVTGGSVKSTLTKKSSTNGRPKDWKGERESPVRRAEKSDKIVEGQEDKSRRRDGRD